MIRGYYLEEGDEVIPFPVAERWESDAEMLVEDDVEMQAQAGDIYVYKNWSVRQWELNFRLTQAQRDFFATLHAAVGGRETPFYFVLDVDESPVEAVLVRKEKEFRPRAVNVVQTGIGTYSRWYEYKLILTEEASSAVSVLE